MHFLCAQDFEGHPRRAAPAVAGQPRVFRQEAKMPLPAGLRSEGTSELAESSAYLAVDGGLLLENRFALLAGISQPPGDKHEPKVRCKSVSLKMCICLKSSGCEFLCHARFPW